MKLRQLVFVVEQECPYLDADGKDAEALHILCCQDQELLAYARIIPKGIMYPDFCAIGRVVTKPSERNKGLGTELMQFTIQQAQLKFPQCKIKISAQCYLLDFYRALGFKDIEEEYLEDNIPHKAMILIS